MTERLCAIDGCEKPYSARGWCKKHYTRWERHGDPLGGGPERLDRDPICAVEVCGRPHMARGWCQKHYVRWRLHGDPVKVALRNRSPKERFWAKVDKSGDCWEWTANKDKYGYGRFGMDRKSLLAHRVAYEWEVGPIPEGLEIDHLCFNRVCVNPDHLEPVTHEENVRRRDACQEEMLTSGS